jgi:hypothetical protein
VAFDADRLGEVRREVRRSWPVRAAADPGGGLPGRGQRGDGNAVRHGAGSGTVRLWRDGRVVCEVTDDGGGFEAGSPAHPIRKPEATEQGGRGLWLAQQYADGMRIDSGPQGTSVQLSKALPTDQAD